MGANLAPVSRGRDPPVRKVASHRLAAPATTQAFCELFAPGADGQDRSGVRDETVRELIRGEATLTVGPMSAHNALVVRRHVDHMRVASAMCLPVG